MATARTPVKKDRKAAKAAPKCPICGKPRAEAYRPFCSKRCADIDLNRWLGGVYAIPVRDSEEDEAERPAREQER